MLLSAESMHDPSAGERGTEETRLFDISICIVQEASRMNEKKQEKEEKKKKTKMRKKEKKRWSFPGIAGADRLRTSSRVSRDVSDVDIIERCE